MACATRYKTVQCSAAQSSEEQSGAERATGLWTRDVTRLDEAAACSDIKQRAIDRLVSDPRRVESSAIGLTYSIVE